jgi:hypothetical protein
LRGLQCAWLLICQDLPSAAAAARLCRKAQFAWSKSYLNKLLLFKIMKVRLYGAQEGEYILREGELLATDSKFYIIEEGLVECLKMFEVRCLLWGSG